MSAVRNVNEVIHHHQSMTSVTFHEQGLLHLRTGRPCAPPTRVAGQQQVTLHEASVLIPSHWICNVGAWSKAMFSKGVYHICQHFQANVRQMCHPTADNLPHRGK